MNYKLSIGYKVNGVTKFASRSNDDFDVVVNKTFNKYHLIIEPKNEIEISFFSVERSYNFSPDSKVFANGFQSWTDTKEFTRDERMSPLGAFGSSAIGHYFGIKYVGDYTFAPQNFGKGVIHSHSYTYIRTGDNIDLLGSLSDRCGYTIFVTDMNNSSIGVFKDLEGKVFTEPTEVLSLYIASGEYDEVFDAYFNEMGVKPLTDKKIHGYTSWYNYYQNINETVILNDLNAIAKEKNYVDTFQVDDGYQTAVGDWLSVDKKKFPGGMKNIADKIHENGFEAGLWLAPFGAKKNSEIAKKHKDWLLRDETGKAVLVGANWGGFYALDIYNDEVRKYLKDVFNTVLNDWGFDLVKLDFLYAASILPRNNKTRGEIAYDSIEFLRECVGDKKILGCGVQMMPCFGKVEYMRVGADMDLRWQHPFKRRFMHREDVSTPNAIHNSIYRRHLNGRAFLCDSDVFLLRDYNISFSQEERELLAKFIKVFGSVLFMSDDISKYNERQLEVFRDTLSDDAVLQSVSEDNDVVTVLYKENDVVRQLEFNVNYGLLPR